MRNSEIHIHLSAAGSAVVLEDVIESLENRRPDGLGKFLPERLLRRQV